MGELYDRFQDILHEVPEAEEALLKWQGERARKILRTGAELSRKARVDATSEPLLVRERALKLPD